MSNKTKYTLWPDEPEAPPEEWWRDAPFAIDSDDEIGEYVEAQRVNYYKAWFQYIKEAGCADERIF